MMFGRTRNWLPKISTFSHVFSFFVKNSWQIDMANIPSFEEGRRADQAKLNATLTSARPGRSGTLGERVSDLPRRADV